MRVVLLLLLLVVVGCQSATPTLFTALDPDQTGVTFANTLTESATQNVLLYEYTYNGGGVATGDLNNDGLADLYFTANQLPNKLYINRFSAEKNTFLFDDVTTAAGVAGRPGHWKTGVTMADVNADGWLDIYVCYSALPDAAARANQLFINNHCAPGGIPTFSERAAEYGLDAPGTFSTQASFFDYDRDGDLDMFLVNHGNMFYAPFFNTRKLRQQRHPFFGNRLYRHEANGQFTDVSAQAGIHGGGINFGLGVGISDLNADGWPDLYVGNDYEEQDYLYLNNQHGQFVEQAQTAFGHTSRNTMGIDIADVNNDARPDIVTTDMLPATQERQKLLKGPDDYDRYQLMVDSGFGRQQMRNMLHLNQSPLAASADRPDGGTTLAAALSTNSVPPSGRSADAARGLLFAEVGQLAGISATDWSWAALLADFDNDGLKDLFVANGLVRDFTSLDFLTYDVAAAKEKLAAQGKDLTTDAAQLIAKLPATAPNNVAFRNLNGLRFQDVARQWGLAEGAVSTGAAYADLDNDGDLDLVVNNTNAPASVYRNNAESQTQNQHLTIRLAGSGGNRFGVGAVVTITRGTRTQTQELMPTRGFQSAVAPVLTVGLGAATAPGNGPVSVQVRWPDGRVSHRAGVLPNTTLTLAQTEAVFFEKILPVARNTVFGASSETLIPFVHRENPYVDYKQEPLIPYQLSRQGPALASADVNADGRADVFVGGATGQASGLFLQQASGRFVPAPAGAWPTLETTLNPPADAVAALFFDADNDHDPDLYVVRGGNEYAPNSPAYQDQLFLNNGGRFTLAPPGTLPTEGSPGSCAAAADYDRDGDLDLFVGGRAVPGQFPTAAPSFLLRNDGNSPPGTPRFAVAQTLTPGMITAAAWADADHNNVPDLLLAGDWMPITLFLNQQQKLVPANPQTHGLAQTGGLWTCLVPHDLDHDGDTDFLVGNLGTNTQWTTGDTSTLTLFAADFNDDGRTDPIISQRVGDGHIPLASRNELLDQINTLRKRYVRYADYATATVEDLIGPGTLATARKLDINTLKSSVLENLGKGRYCLRALPDEAQISPVQGFVVADFTADGVEDIALAGNYFPLRVQQGRADAGRGLLLAGTKTGRYTPVSAAQSSLTLSGDIRRLLGLATPAGTLLVAARNAAPVVTQRVR